MHFCRMPCKPIQGLGKKVHCSVEQLQHSIQQAMQQCALAVQSPTSQVLLLVQQAHEQFWQKVSQLQLNSVPSAILESTQLKMNALQNAYGTVLFFEDLDEIKQFKKHKPLQAEQIEQWAAQSTGMVQLAVWATLANQGMGASPQFYYSGDDQTRLLAELRQLLDIPVSWQLKSQLVFGSLPKMIEQALEIELEPIQTVTLFTQL